MFESLEKLPLDPIFGLNLQFYADNRPFKVNLGMGVYKTEELQPLIFPVVKEVEGRLLREEKSKDYLPIDGLPSYVRESARLVFGEGVDFEHLCGVQTLGGTGGLRLGGNLLFREGCRKLYYSDPTWENHKRIFTQAGFEIAPYPYYDRQRRCLDFEKLSTFIETLASKSVLLLHACCHNPTGLDPSLEQWQELADKIQKRGIFPFFDLAYQGFGEGLEADVRVIRLFQAQGIEMAVAASHSKNFGLYAERVGALYFFFRNREVKEKILSHVKVDVRGVYSNPPCHGAQVVAAILGEGDLRKKWVVQLEGVRLRIQEMRNQLGQSLQRPLTHVQGMFGYLGLTKEQVEKLREKYAIYMPNDGRVNIAGINAGNLEYIVEALRDVVE